LIIDENVFLRLERSRIAFNQGSYLGGLNFDLEALEKVTVDKVVTSQISD